MQHLVPCCPEPTWGQGRLRASEQRAAVACCLAARQFVVVLLEVLFASTTEQHQRQLVSFLPPRLAKIGVGWALVWRNVFEKKDGGSPVSSELR